jgi:hypothetical protein
MNTRQLLAVRNRENISLDMGGSNVGTAAWVVVATLSHACDALQIDNSGDDSLLIGIGDPGSEIQQPYIIGPCEKTPVIPFPLAKGVTISVKSRNHTVVDGDLIINTFD